MNLLRSRADALTCATAQVRRNPLRMTAVAAVVACVGVFAPAMSADSNRVGAYDFSYATTGDNSVKPVQVFDDGRNTFLQFRAGTAVPAIFSSRNGGMQLVLPSSEGPYVRLPDLHGSLVLQLGRAQAQVVHAGGSRLDAPQLSVNTQAGQQPLVPGAQYAAGAQLVASLSAVPLNMNSAPALVDDGLQRNSYATPRRGDAVVWHTQPSAVDLQRSDRDVWFPQGSMQVTAVARTALNMLARSLPSSARIIVTGRDDESYKDGLDRARAHAIRDVLIKAGVASERITVRQGAAGKRDGRLWASTVTVETAADAAAPGGAAARSTAVVDNLQNLIRAGVLRQEQAEAIMRTQGMSLPQVTQAAAAPAPVAASQAGGQQRPASTAPVVKGWEVRKADATVQQMLVRWAGEAGWTLVWKDGPVIPITGDRALPASDFISAADVVVAQSQAAGYRIAATAYSNSTLVITAGVPTTNKQEPK